MVKIVKKITVCYNGRSGGIMNKYKFALFVCAFVWGFGYVAMDHLVNATNPLLAIAIRFIFASLVIWLYKRKEIKFDDFKSNISPILILGSALFLGFLFQTYGLSLTTTSKNAFLTATNVIWTPIIVSIFYKYKVTNNVKIGSLLMIVGIALVSLDGLSAFNLGDILTLIGALFFAIHIIFINRLANTHNLDVIVFGQLLITGLWALGTTVIFSSVTIQFGSEFLISLIFAAVFSTALCFFLQNYGLSQVDSSSGAIILSLESMFGVVAALLIDREPINLVTVVGFIVMSASILIAEKNSN